METPAISGETAEELERYADSLESCHREHTRAAAILREVAALRRAGVLK